MIDQQQQCDFDRLKAAHDCLFSAYIKAYKASRGRRRSRRLIGDHLSRQAEAVRRAYIQAGEGPFHSSDEQEWLDGEAERLKRLRDSFAPLRVRVPSLFGLSSLLPLHSLFGLVGASSIVAGVLAALGQCLCELTAYVPLLATAFFYVLLVDPFNDKRKLFRETATGVEGGIYGAEDTLFKSLDDEKPAERRTDVVGWCLIAVAWLGGWAIREWAVHHHMIFVHRAWIWLVFAGIALTAGIAAASKSANPRPVGHGPVPAHN